MMVTTGIDADFTCVTIDAPAGSSVPPWAVRIIWAAKNEAKAVTSPMTKMTTAMTIFFAAITVYLFGTVAKVVRIRPVEYSEVMIMAPRIPTTS